MPGGDYTLGGPFYWFVVGLLVLAGMLSAFVVLHVVLVSRRGRLAASPGSVTLYAVPQAIYFVLLFVVQTSLLPPIASAVLVLATPLALAQQMAYLLRVVFPKPPAEADVAAAVDEVGDVAADEHSSELPES